MYGEMFELHSELLKALAHPRRLEILHLLRDQELMVTDIYTMLDLPQANISQHLMILRESGIVATQRQGKHILYSVADPKIIQASDLLREILIDQHEGTAVADTLSLKMKDLVPIVHDPVCQMRLSPKTAGFTLVFNNKRYFFCASGCLHAFEKNPSTYLNSTERSN